jgi:tetratricopeptide (TPR) repeat protein
MRNPQERRRSDGGRDSSGRKDRGRPPSSAPRPDPSPPEPQYEWIDEGPVGGSRSASSNGGEAKTKRNRSRGTGALAVSVPSFTAAVGQQRGRRLEGRFEDAARAFAAERFTEARSILKPIEAEAPAIPEVQELYGLTLYRLGRWTDAATHLREFVNLTGGSVEQHPVLADCERALGHHDTVDRLWAELREVSPSAELVTEGRIVAAGSLADRGELSSAIALLSKGFRFPRKPREHHLRRTYALADLYERSGDLPQARQLFDRVARVSPGFVDVEDRIEALG